MNTNQNTAVDDENETIGGGVRRHVDQPLSFYERRRVRHGKTQRDHSSGSWKRRLDNQELRGNWINESRGKHIGWPPFPTHVCKGLGNSSKRFKEKAGKIVRG